MSVYAAKQRLMERLQQEDAKRMVKYRLLEEGERIQEGDESLDEDAVNWNPVHWMHFKSMFKEGFHMPMRRPV